MSATIYLRSGKTLAELTSVTAEKQEKSGDDTMPTVDDEWTPPYVPPILYLQRLK